MLRRLIILLIVGGALALTWTNLEAPYDPGDPFLAVVEAGGRWIVVRSTDPVPGRDARFVLEGTDGSEPRTRTGEPRVVVASGGSVLVLFESSGARLVAREEGGELNWSTVRYPTRRFHPLAAVEDGEGGTLVVGRRRETEDVAVWGRVAPVGDGEEASEEIVLEEGELPIGSGALDVQMIRAEEGPFVLWRESTASGIAVHALALPPVPGAHPETLAEVRDMETFVATSGAGGIRLLVLEAADRLTVHEGSARQEVSLAGLRTSARVRLAVSGGDSPGLLALVRGEVVRWPLDAEGRPVGDQPSLIVEPPEVRGWFVALSAFAAMAITILLLRPRGLAARRTDAGDHEVEAAPVLPRLGAWLLDMALVMPLAHLSAAAVLEVDLGAVLEGFLERRLTGEAETVILLGELLTLVYFTSAEAIFGRTLGKHALGLRVVRLDGGRPSLPAILARNLLRVAVDYYGFAVLVFLTRRRQRVGDYVARTLVVRAGTRSCDPVLASDDRPAAPDG